jgi:glyoxylase-like metal-dependent hydrolase (beta-lactamase superfamily II)
VIVLECLDVRVSAIASRSGIVVIDTDRVPAVMERLRGAIERELGRRDFLYVVNTHGDPDHASGNAALPSARLIAHRNFMPFVLHAKAARLHARWAAQSRLEDARSRYAKLDPTSDEAVDLRGRIATLEVFGEGSSGESISRIPDIVFDDSLTLDLGDLTLEMRFCGEAHTNHDIVVYVPEERLLFTGDLICSPESPCFPVNAMCDAPRLVRELEGLLHREAGLETVVPGHGEVLARDDLETFCRVLSERYAKVVPENSAAWILGRTMEREGLGPALERVPLPPPGASGTPYWSEEELAALGGRLVRKGRADDAVRVLRLSLRALPESALLTGTLGDALLERDNRDAATAAYARCLALMPEHRRAAEMLKAIEATAPTSTRPAE